MFENLSLKGFTWPREPVLYLTLLVAVLNVVIQALSGDVTWITAVESVIGLVLGFVARSQVAPMSNVVALKG